MSELSEHQESFIRYVLKMLSLKHPYGYLILQKLVMSAGRSNLNKVREDIQTIVTDLLLGRNNIDML